MMMLPVRSELKEEPFRERVHHWPVNNPAYYKEGKARRDLDA